MSDRTPGRRLYPRGLFYVPFMDIVGTVLQLTVEFNVDEGNITGIEWRPDSHCYCCTPSAATGVTPTGASITATTTAAAAIDIALL